MEGIYWDSMSPGWVFHQNNWTSWVINSNYKLFSLIMSFALVGSDTMDVIWLNSIHLTKEKKKKSSILYTLRYDVYYDHVILRFFLFILCFLTLL